LAKKYYTINPNDLFQLQQMISSKEMTKEQLTYAVKTIQPGNTGGQGEPVKQTSEPIQIPNSKNIGFYFDNDIPKKGDNVANFASQYAAYSGNVSNGEYTKKSTAALTQSFFTSVVEPNYKQIQKLVKNQHHTIAVWEMMEDWAVQDLFDYQDELEKGVREIPICQNSRLLN
jgi:hypothetical protein